MYQFDKTDTFDKGSLFYLADLQVGRYAIETKKIVLGACATMKNKMMKELEKLENSLKYMTKDLKEIEDSWSDHFNANDPDDMYLRSAFAKAEDKLSDVRRTILGINAPVIAEGRLYKNSAGRYQIQGTEVYFTSGSTLEVLYARYALDPREWIESSVEHNGTDYCLTRLQGVSMEGLIARAKEYPMWN